MWSSCKGVAFLQMAQRPFCSSIRSRRTRLRFLRRNIFSAAAARRQTVDTRTTVILPKTPSRVLPSCLTSSPVTFSR